MSKKGLSVLLPAIFVVAALSSCEPGGGSSTDKQDFIQNAAAKAVAINASVRKAIKKIDLSVYSNSRVSVDYDANGFDFTKEIMTGVVDGYSRRYHYQPGTEVVTVRNGKPVTNTEYDYTLTLAIDVAGTYDNSTPFFDEIIAITRIDFVATGQKIGRVEKLVSAKAGFTRNASIMIAASILIALVFLLIPLLLGFGKQKE